MAQAVKKQRTLDSDLKAWLKAADGEEASLAALDEIVAAYGADQVDCWKDESAKGIRLIHWLVRQGWDRQLEAAVTKHKLNVNAQRDSDGCTAAHLAVWFGKDATFDKLQALGADTNTIKNKYGESADDKKLKAEREKHERLIFLDLELTAGFKERVRIGSRKILEAAIVITDKHLKEKARGQWVVGGFSKDELNGLGEWQQRTFRDPRPGGEFPPLPGAEDGAGNGLFSEALASELSLQEVEAAMLALVRKHCPEGVCPLVGHSVHCDREVLALEMPAFYAHPSYKILELSTVPRLGALWGSDKTSTRKVSVMPHRAMQDVEESITTLGWIRDNFFQKGHAASGAGQRPEQQPA